MYMSQHGPHRGHYNFSASDSDQCLELNLKQWANIQGQLAINMDSFSTEV